MTLLTKDQILKSSDIAHRDIDVEEWGGTIRIAAMSAAEKDSFEAGMLNNNLKSDPKRLLNFRARFIASCIVDEGGKRIFAAGDVVALGKKSAAPVSRVFDECREINGMSEADVEEIEGN
jgi:hypothetical protein